MSMNTRVAWFSFALAAALILGGSLAGASPTTDEPEPGPVTVGAQVDYWGSYKVVRVEVAQYRPHQAPITTQTWLDSDREPSSGGLENEFELEPGVIPRVGSVGWVSDIWREDAPIVFETLDEVCPALKNAC
jgi:hypothetical protein